MLFLEDTLLTIQESKIKFEIEYSSLPLRERYSLMPLSTLPGVSSIMGRILLFPVGVVFANGSWYSMFLLRFMALYMQAQMLDSMLIKASLTSTDCLSAFGV